MNISFITSDQVLFWDFCTTNVYGWEGGRIRASTVSSATNLKTKVVADWASGRNDNKSCSALPWTEKVQRVKWVVMVLNFIVLISEYLKLQWAMIISWSRAVGLTHVRCALGSCFMKCKVSLASTGWCGGLPSDLRCRWFTTGLDAAMPRNREED